MQVTAPANDIAAQLTRHEAFARLSEDVASSVASVSKRLRVEAGDAIVREGDTSRDLFVLVSGTAVAVRQDKDNVEVKLNTIDTGECIGELTFLEGGVRAASVKAQTPCQVIMVPVDALAALPDHREVIGELKGILAGVVVRRSRRLSDEILAATKEQLAVKTLQNQFGYFLILTISLFLVTTGLLYMVHENYVQDIYNPSFTWQTVLLLAIPSITVIRLMKIPPYDLGIRSERFWRSLAEAIVVCVVFTIPVAIYLYVSGDLATERDSGTALSASFVAQYFIHCILQEVGARGLLQNLFQKFLADERGHKSVVFASVVFASLHITFGIDAVLVTLVASFGFGYLYLKQKNLAGVILVHFWLGLLAAYTIAF
ncbi:MAG: cyclic nucleotide-binding domain-containing protein [Pseudomonadota bacterium]